MVTFSAKGTAAPTDFGSPPTLRAHVIDLEDTTTDYTRVSEAARHRLPVFLNLKDDSSNAHPISGRGTPHRTREMLRFSKIPGHSVEQPPDFFTTGKILSEGTESSVPRRRVSPIRTMCGGQCDGVTCMLSTTSVIESPCLKVEEIKENLGKPSLNLSGIPILDRVCPFHHIPSLWLVPHCFVLTISSPSNYIRLSSRSECTIIGSHANFPKSYAV